MCAITDYRLAISWTDRPTHVCNHRLQTHDLVDRSTYSRMQAQTYRLAISWTDRPAHVCNHKLQTHDLVDGLTYSRGRIDLLTCAITHYRLAISWTDRPAHVYNHRLQYRLTISWTDRPTHVCNHRLQTHNLVDGLVEALVLREDKEDDEEHVDMVRALTATVVELTIQE